MSRLDRLSDSRSDHIGSVLDRLIGGDAPLPPEAGHGSADCLVRALGRDLEWLLNGRQPDRGAFSPDDGRDVLAWGLPDLTELDLAREPDQLRLARWVAAAIAHFEPRLQHVRVEPVAASGRSLSRTTLRVEATLRLVTGAQPLTFDTIVSWPDRRIAVREEGT